ncbi:hypothetical protein NXC12_PD00300 (plasmid) [Rhizobium etli]|uniref:Uncharacterized protein n=1 Tax=Rhizobium etli TaxID=29449 RepID=A0AAN1EMW0_RHIET|nr:hypothetical protein NXC12_PD00300 [Rhizobium etli]
MRIVTTQMHVPYKLAAHATPKCQNRRGQMAYSAQRKQQFGSLPGFDQSICGNTAVIVASRPTGTGRSRR